jgi:hypothetical protein
MENIIINMELQDLIFMIAAVLIGAIIVYLFLWILPIILPIIIVLIIAYLIYGYFKYNKY